MNTIITNPSFPSSKKIALGRELEAIERPKADSRMRETQAKPGEQVGCDKLAQPSHRGRVREIVADTAARLIVTLPKSKHPRFTLVLQHAHDPCHREPAVALRMALKLLGRAFGLKCIEVRQLPAITTEPAGKPLEHGQR